MSRGDRQMRGDSMGIIPPLIANHSRKAPLYEAGRIWLALARSLHR